jgi:hypothetical protein
LALAGAEAPADRAATAAAAMSVLVIMVISPQTLELGDGRDWSSLKQGLEQ